MPKSSRPRVVVALVACLGFAGCKDGGSSSSKGGAAPQPAPEPSAGPAPAGDGSTAFSGTVLLDLEPMEGQAPETVAGAKVSVVDHPEISATADADGHVELPPTAPGTLTIIALSADGTALTAGPAAYGLKLDDVLVKAGERNDLGAQAVKATGALMGVVDFYGDQPDLDRTGSDVFVPGTGLLAKTDAQGRFTLAGLPEGHYKLRAQHTGFAPLDLHDVVVTSGQTTDLGTMLLSLSVGPEGAIDVTPDVEATIGGKVRKIKTSRTVPYTLRFDSDTALMKISDEPAFLSRDWQPAAASGTWEFDSDGLKTLYVTFSDLNGLESSPFAVELYVDTLPPTLSDVRILYGWSQTASRYNFVDVTASDDSTGVATAKLSFVSDQFPDDLAALPFSPRLDFDFGASVTSGVKTVYVKVRDYAGHESVVRSDSITKGAETLVAAGTYSTPVTLRASQSPFRINEGTTFEGDVTIEPGTEVRLTYDGTASGVVNFKGVVTAQGTGWAAGQSIRIVQDQGASCSMMLKLNEGALGISEKNRLSHVEFKNVNTISFNGGRVTDGKFTRTSDCNLASNGDGNIEKTGADPLWFENNQFTEWSKGMRVRNGDGATSVVGSTGTVYQFFQQDSPATNTLLKGNNVTAQGGGSGSYHLTVNSGALRMESNTFAGPIDFVSHGGSMPLTISDVTVSGCYTAVSQQSTAPLTIEGSSLSCTMIADYMSTGSGAITYAYDDLTVSARLDTVLIGTRQYDHSNITCAGASCDLVRYATFVDPGASAFTFTDNNINCLVADGCRGGIVFNGSLYPSAFSTSFDFTRNHWSGKQPPKSPSTFLTTVDYGDTGNLSTADAAGIAIYEYTTAHPGTPQAPGSGKWTFTGDYAAADPGARAAGRAAWPGP